MNRNLKAGLFLFGVIVSLSFVLPLLIEFDPLKQNLELEFSPPSLRHLFGFGENGVDLFASTLIGLRNSLLVSFFAAFFSSCLGSFLSFLSVSSKKWDWFLVKIAEIFESFPGIILIVGLAAILGPSAANVILIVGLTGWVVFYRLIRANLLSLLTKDFILAALAIGQKQHKIWLKHVIPHVGEFFLVQLSLTMGSVMIIESSLGFLGLGSPPGTPSLGALIHQGRDVMTLAPHALIIPGSLLILCVVAFNFLSMGLGEKFDSRRNIYTPKS